MNYRKPYSGRGGMGEKNAEENSVSLLQQKVTEIRRNGNIRI